MSDWIAELNERSKIDRAFIAGSEVRALVAEVTRLTAALEAATAERDALEDCVSTVPCTVDAHATLEDRALAAEAEVRVLHGLLRDAGFDLTHESAASVLSSILAARAERIAAEAEVERLRGEYAWQTKNADNCRSDASRMGQLWEQAVKDWKAAEAANNEARGALKAIVDGWGEDEKQPGWSLDDAIALARGVLGKEGGR